jgi:hypothetical protein
MTRCPTGLPIKAGWDTAWIWTRVSVVMPLALRCSALDRCTTREPPRQFFTTVTIWDFCLKYYITEAYTTDTRIGFILKLIPDLNWLKVVWHIIEIFTLNVFPPIDSMSHSWSMTNLLLMVLFSNELVVTTLLNDVIRDALDYKKICS